MSEMIYAGNMPVLALRGLAIFPDQTVHFDVGRPKSALALEAAMKENQTLFLTPIWKSNSTNLRFRAILSAIATYRQFSRKPIYFFLSSEFKSSK